jgi:hypothetical protein
LEANGVWDLRFQRVDLGFLLRTTGYCADAVFRGVKTETGGQECDVCAADRGAKSLYRRQDLLVEVVVDIWLEFAAGLDYFVDGVGVLCCVFGGAGRFASDDEAHDVLGFNVLALGLEAQSYLHGWHGVAVGVFLGILAELRVNGVLTRWNFVLAHSLAELAEVVVDILDGDFGVIATEEEVEQFPTTTLAIWNEHRRSEHVR